MPKIGFFIIPNINNSFIINKEKRKIKQQFGKQIYLEHFPHITLGVVNVNSKFINNFKLDTNKLRKKINKKILTVNKPFIFKNDILAKNGTTLVYKIKKFNWLEELQIEILQQLQAYRNKKINDIKLNKMWMTRNLKNFGFPFVGKYWIPHITISSINENKKNKNDLRKFIKFFLKEKILIKQKIDNITFFKILKNKHELIKKYRI